MPQTYDPITDEFSRGLSPLARRLYAAIFELSIHSGYIASWHLRDVSPDFEGIDCVYPSEAEDAKRDLIRVGLIQEVPDLGSRYQPTSNAWGTHIQHLQWLVAKAESDHNISMPKVRQALHMFPKEDTDRA